MNISARRPSNRRSWGQLQDLRTPGQRPKVYTTSCAKASISSGLHLSSASSSICRQASCTWQCAIKNVANHRGGSQCFGPGPARPAQPLTSIGRPGPPSPHFYRQGPGPARPPNPSLLSTGPRPAWPPTPHFYWPDPSLLLARPLTSSGHPLTARSWPSWAIPANRSVVYG